MTTPRTTAKSAPAPRARTVLLVWAVLFVWACLLSGCSDPAADDFEAAERALQSGRPERAVELLDRALASDGLSEPLMARALHYRALIHLDSNEFAAAEADAGQALEHSLRRAETYQLRGMARLAQDKTSLAMEDFDAALVIDPGNPAALTYRGQMRLEQKDAAGAEADLTRVVDSGRADRGLMARTLYLRGEAKNAQGRTQDALVDLDLAAKASPGSDLAMAAAMRAAELHAKDGDQAAAEQALDTVISQRPAMADGWRRRGMVRYLDERYVPARQDFEKALELAPDDPELQNQLAWLLATAPEPGARDGERAVALAQRAVDLTQTGNPLFIDTLAAALAEAGRFHEAVTAQETALMILEQNGPPELEAEFRQRLALFRSGRAYHAAPEG